jgi:hypothetical protein
MKSGLLAHAPTSAAIARAIDVPKRIARRSKFVSRRHLHGATCGASWPLGTPALRGDIAMSAGARRRCCPNFSQFRRGPPRRANAPRAVIATNRALFRSRAAIIRRPSHAPAGSAIVIAGRHPKNPCAYILRLGREGASTSMFSARHKRRSPARYERPPSPAQLADACAGWREFWRRSKDILSRCEMAGARARAKG